jgi:transcriptional regulator with XRE-family HTH domain
MLARLRAARERARLTEAEVEHALDLPAGIVAKWESGRSLLYALEFADLAALYGRPMAHFIGVGSV